jgi:ribonuclease-3
LRDSPAGISYRFGDPQLLRAALTHRSAGAGNNERLEFLGDSVLNMIIAMRLYELHPEAQEGDLSRMRARLVRGTTLSGVASSIGLGEEIRLGEGELKSGGFRRASILPPPEELKDSKTRLQEWLQARGRPLPQYSLERESGADHAKQFLISCRLPDDGTQAEMTGRSRRKAEQAAAGRVLELLLEAK